MTENEETTTVDPKECQFGEGCEPAIGFYILEGSGQGQVPICQKHVDDILTYIQPQTGCTVKKMTIEDYEAYKLINI